MLNPIGLAERGFLPNKFVRMGTRRLLAQRLKGMPTDGAAESRQFLSEFAQKLRSCTLAVETGVANEQHYEVPSEFFQNVLGPRLKYSSCYFANPQTSLSEAEEKMLRITCERAEIEDGFRVLDLGCGWGSLTLWIAQQFPASSITAVSNSNSQREFIEKRARSMGLNNIRVITADIRDLAIAQKFDRVVSVEMFEHMQNYELLFRRVSNWLTPRGKVSAHIFCHRQTPYLFQTEGSANWMGRHFFTGGTMPSEHLFAQFQDDLTIERQWRVSGLHYWRTCEEWLKQLDRNRKTIVNVLRQDLSRAEAERNVQQWRIFFMACAELFRYGQGEEWYVTHYLFRGVAPRSKVNNHASINRVGRLEKTFSGDLS